MRANEFIVEALKPSQYRPFVKGWDKTKYAELFDNKYRIYLPITNTEKEQVLTPDPKVSAAVMSAGYKIDDYKTGIASQSNNPNRKIKIGKLLKDPEVIKLFANDSARGASKNVKKLVVISRHPYDIAGMTSGRGWYSCMNLDDQGKHYVPLDIKSGTVVAYLIDVDDTNIEHPSARMLIKPFVNKVNGTIAFGIENKVYGTASPEFTKVVRAWVNKINVSRKLDGIYELDPALYPDTGGDQPKPKIHGSNKELYQKIFADPKQFLLDNPNASEKLQLLAVTQDGDAIAYIKTPSEAVQLAAVTEYGVAIEDIIRNGIMPSEAVIMAALAQNGDAIKYIDAPSEKMQLAAVTQNGHAIRHNKNPSEAVQLAAVAQDGQAIQYILDKGIIPSEKMQLAAVTQNGHAIKYIDAPSEKMQLAAVTQNGRAIRHNKNPSEAVQLAAVAQDGQAIQYILDKGIIPSEAVQLAAGY